jgi:hypothetical protein
VIDAASAPGLRPRATSTVHLDSRTRFRGAGTCPALGGENPASGVQQAQGRLENDV